MDGAGRNLPACCPVVQKNGDAPSFPIRLKFFFKRSITALKKREQTRFLSVVCFPLVSLHAQSNTRHRAL
jgi:hypothetical protein